MAEGSVPPTPPPVSIDLSNEDILEALEGVVLAPYFSAILKGKTTDEVKYFILGQSPDGYTTLRATDGGVNANLGRGSDPEPNAFLELLRHRLVGRSE